MKLSITLFLASVGSVSAFVAPASQPRCLPLHMSDPRDEKPGVWNEQETPTNSAPTMSKAIPFVKCPPALDGSMGGDVGFDPLGLSKTSKDLASYREAEIKHARLAMLAAAGWPISELFDKKIATVLGLAPALDAAGRVPSVLNGGMGKISPFYWGACILVAAAIDAYGFTSANKKAGYIPGDLGFDPFGLYPKDEKGKKWMQTAEIKNGRLAMIAITAFAAQEFVSHVAVIDETPFFFKPIWQALSETSSNGYIVPPVDAPAVLDAITAPLDAAVTAPLEAATSVIPPVEFAPPPVAPPVAPIEAAAVNPFAEATSAPAVVAPPVVAPPVEAAIVNPFAEVAAPPVAPAVTPPVDNSELAIAQRKIAELEARLSEIR